MFGRNWKQNIFVLVALLLVLAFFAGVLVFSVAPACWPGDGSAETAVSIARCQVALTQGEGALLLTSAILAVLALVDARQRSVRELRAYVFVDKLEIFDPEFDPSWNASSGLVRAIIQLRNSGSTPAIKAFHWAHIVLATHGDEHHMNVPDDIQQTHRNWIAAGGTLFKTLDLAQRLTAQQEEALRAGTLAVYVFGVIRYRDIFGRRRETSYRVFQTGYPPKSGVSFCPQGNETD
jgi:hypothetical protein